MLWKWFVSEKEWLSGMVVLSVEVVFSFFVVEVGVGVVKVDEGESLVVLVDYN